VSADYVLRCRGTCPHGDRCTRPDGHTEGCNHRCDCNEPSDFGPSRHTATIKLPTEQYERLIELMKAPPPVVAAVKRLLDIDAGGEE
tara:strand:+ start:233 stop:493 length:261 start_codon:yes stop_codon:yes gene_type:complete